MKKKVWLVFLVAVAIVADQLVKYVVRTSRLERDFFSLFKLRFGASYHENYGFIGDVPAPYWLIVLVMILFLIVLFYFFWLFGHSAFGLALIIAGALSNLFDRAAHGFVVDYIRIGTSIFNGADVFIVIGALLVLLLDWQRKKENSL